MDSFDPVTRQGLSITNLFWLELAISAALLALVVGVLIIAVVRFHVLPTDKGEPEQVQGNRRLEVIWTATPAATLVVMFVLVVGTLRTVDAAQPASEPARVVGHQWWWEFSYPGRQVVTANELHMPVGTPLQISLQSADVIP
jgi:cytochrome c oxidase subunit II